MELDQKHKRHVTKIKTAYTVIPRTARIQLPLFAATWFYFVSIERKDKLTVIRKNKDLQI
jgi:hypothetical protein